MAGEYARDGKSVLFLEHDFNHSHGNRLDRWYDGYGRQPAFAPPWVMVDSGFRVSGGYEDYYVAYGAMVEASRVRPALADVDAWYEREGVNNLDVYVTVTNRSGHRLTDDLLPTVNVIAYERRRVSQTGRYVRAATARQIGALNDGATGTYYIALSDVPVVAWDDVGVVALVDYRPDPYKTAFDSLQAALAVAGPPPTFTPTATLPSTAMPPPTATATATRTPGPSPTAPPTRTPGGEEAGTTILLPFAEAH